MSKATFSFRIICYSLYLIILAATGGSLMAQDANTLQLPEPDLAGEVTLEQCLGERRSHREFSGNPLTLEQLSQVLWAAQGITADWGARTAPSAGGLFPLVLYVAVEGIEGIDNGVWMYDPETHSLTMSVEGDLLGDIAEAAVSQMWMADASAILVITAIPAITEARYADRSMRYIDNEVGGVCQNVYLQCEALSLGTCAVGAMYDDQVATIVSTEASVRLLMPIGTID